ncbi:hypothetical protein RhiirA5_18011 [Rhizophagus irregularis]|uniref:VHS domain-containing protein n=1 Tax=Rhizophagus irregularis TaxID=588596 RepID=A0A2I1DUC9_9GLOM|nr:hypothetical protein RhiirA5_18011 [Rhizophagus irregularis]PKC68184.1 hypothetical protein RhiirA1_151457 [Rhizophagus irregularis]PKY13449.1 hypothetical protein RhiirB3_121074 [Rhizophagus irregularis]
MSVCDSGTANLSELEVLRQYNTELKAKVAELEGTISLRTLDLLDKDILSPSFEAFTVLSCGHLFHRECVEKSFLLTCQTECKK